jgi:hypothetical protein
MFKRFFVVITLFIFFSSCKKNNSSVDTISTYKQILTGGSSKTWALNKLFVNGTENILTPGQARYTKAFKADNTWIDSDGHSGTYTLTSTKKITETTIVPAQTEKIEYTIRSIENTKIELEYTLSNTTYRLVFGL